MGHGNGVRQGWQTLAGEMNSSVGVCHLELAGGVSLGMGVWVMGMGVPGPGAEGHCGE